MDSDIYRSNLHANEGHLRIISGLGWVALPTEPTKVATGTAGRLCEIKADCTQQGCAEPMKTSGAIVAVSLLVWRTGSLSLDPQTTPPRRRAVLQTLLGAATAARLPR